MTVQQVKTGLRCPFDACLFVGVVGGGWDVFDNCVTSGCSCPGPPSFPSTPGLVIRQACVDTLQQSGLSNYLQGMCLPISADHQPSPSKLEVCSIFVGKSDGFPDGWMYFRKDGGPENKGHMDGFDPGVKNLLIIQAIGEDGKPSTTVAVGYIDLGGN